MTIKRSILAGAAALALTAGAASAATVSLTGSSPIALAPGSPVGQDFVTQLQAAGVDTLYSGPLTLSLSGAAKLTFSLVAAESSFNNSLLFDGSAVITENFSNTALVDFTSGDLGSTFETILGAGNFESLLSFDINGDGIADFGAGDDEFGIFAKASDIGSLSRFYLALDDSGANNDDNHDDIIIRVDVSAVPLPAAGWMLLAGLGGIAAMKRRKKA